jgi:hypothetical protein
MVDGLANPSKTVPTVTQDRLENVNFLCGQCRAPHPDEWRVQTLSPDFFFVETG